MWADVFNCKNDPLYVGFCSRPPTPTRPRPTSVRAVLNSGLFVYLNYFNKLHRYVMICHIVVISSGSSYAQSLDIYHFLFCWNKPSFVWHFILSSVYYRLNHIDDLSTTSLSDNSTFQVNSSWSWEDTMLGRVYTQSMNKESSTPNCKI